MNDERWTDERLSALDASSEWAPDSRRALAKLKARGRGSAMHLRRWMLAAAGVCGTVAIVMLLPTSGHCAGLTCSQPSIEIYSDYQCPSCADFYELTYPRILEKYVKTGKVKVVHRDFPLPRHAYAKLAARYANAARDAGFYEVAARQIFRTQALWSTNGQIGEQLDKVIPAAAMERIRQTAESSHDEFAADIAMGVRDGVTGTPTMIVVYSGKREKLTPIPAFAVVESYLDELLKH